MLCLFLNKHQKFRCASWIKIACAIQFQKGTVIHELAHAQGIIHEQSRPDRDQYINIKWENIGQPFKPQFGIHRSASDDGPYDLDSVMHYGDKVSPL